VTEAGQPPRFLFAPKNASFGTQKRFCVVWIRLLKILANFVFFAFVAVSAYGFDKLWYNRNAM